MANSSTGVRIAIEPLRSVFNAALSTINYTALGGPIDNYCRLLSISNNTDQDIFVSLDAINPHIYVASNGFIVRDYTANKDDRAGQASLPFGTQLYVVSVNAPTTGYVYAEVTYISNN